MVSEDHIVISSDLLRFTPLEFKAKGYCTADQIYGSTLDFIIE